MNDGERPNPDALLSSIQREQSAMKRGKLKVFLGMCPGVGKTYAMLGTAQRELKADRNVVIGYVETHGRKETDALTEGLPIIPRKGIEYRGVALSEMDLDTLLARKPQVALVDELAHTNAVGSRHPKRYQDVQELLDCGIDVITTLNVQHVESRADIVRQITGAEIRETVPDSVLDDAILELVDLPPDELAQRLREGKVYVPNRAAAAAENYFREANLTVLRELALRLVADHVGVDTRELRQIHTLSNAPWKTAHCLLVAVGPSPYSESLIRWTRRMADSLKCRWLAVHIESSRVLTDPARLQLEKNLSAAHALGAEVITTTDDDLVRGLLRVASTQNVTQVIVGKPAGSGWWEWARSSRFLRRLTHESGGIDLHIVQAEKGSTPAATKTWAPPLRSKLEQYFYAVAIIGATALINLALTGVAGPRAPGLVFLLSVVLLALKLDRGPVLFAGALSALVWNFFFLPPTFTFTIRQIDDAILFGLYFVVAIVLGQLVARIRTQEAAERQREERAVALYELTRDMAEASSRDEVVWQLVSQVNRVFRAGAAVILPVNEALTVHPDSLFVPSDKEVGVAAWTFRQGKSAGRFTDNLPGAEALHLPIMTERKTFGVLAVDFKDNRPTLAQRELLEAYVRQAALVFDRVELRAAAEQSRLLAESERLGRTLLNSISHELRTPLAASTSAAAALATSPGASLKERQIMVEEIQEANSRLNRIVGNLLDVARLESAKIVPRLDWHDVCDLIQTTIREVRRDLASHPVKLDLPKSPTLVRIDFSLMQHAITNLLLNAVHHTPTGTEIDIAAQLAPGELVVSVADLGPGISQELLPRIFDKFTRGAGAPPGGSGLGLTIVKGFVEAHHGSVIAENRAAGGAVFTIRLPQTETPPNMNEP